MRSVTIKEFTAEDRRFPLEGGAGSDSVHNGGYYGYAVCRLRTDTELEGVGICLTMGPGNDLVCRAIEALAGELAGREIHELMADFGAVFASLTDNPCYRWLGPHKGVVHLALASITNACFDLWAKAEGVPLWKLLLDRTPEEIVALLDFRYVEDVLTRDEALDILRTGQKGREGRAAALLQTGYRGYDTSVGWFNYPDELVAENTKKAMEQGFTAMKLKVGSVDPERDIRRAELIRKTAGDEATIMVDANQQWTLEKALYVIDRLRPIDPYWVEEPTDPDDVLAHQTLRRAFHPIRIALGEHVPNKVLFKNYLLSEAVDINQVDATRVGGISEFLLVALMSKRFNVPVIPHVGDMGQIHQHMVLFDRIGLGLPNLFLEYIPHLRKYFKHPAVLKDGYYQVPQEPGLSCDFLENA